MPQYHGYQLKQPATKKQREIIHKMEQTYKSIRGASKSPKLDRQTAQKIISHYYDDWIKTIKESSQNDNEF